MAETLSKSKTSPMSNLPTPARCIQFPVEIDEQLSTIDECNELVVDCVSRRLKALNGKSAFDSTSQHLAIAQTLLSRLTQLMPEAVGDDPQIEAKPPEIPFFSLWAYGLEVIVFVLDTLEFQVFSESDRSFTLTLKNERWMVEPNDLDEGPISLDNILSANKFCDRVYQVYEQVLVTLKA